MHPVRGGEKIYCVDRYSGLILISAAKQQAHIPLTRHREMQINMHTGLSGTGFFTEYVQTTTRAWTHWCPRFNSILHSLEHFHYKKKKKTVKTWLALVRSCTKCHRPSLPSFYHWLMTAIICESEWKNNKWTDVFNVCCVFYIIILEKYSGSCLSILSIRF